MLVDANYWIFMNIHASLARKLDKDSFLVLYHKLCSTEHLNGNTANWLYKAVLDSYQDNFLGLCLFKIFSWLFVEKISITANLWLYVLSSLARKLDKDSFLVVWHNKSSTELIMQRIFNNSLLGASLSRIQPTGCIFNNLAQ